MPSKITFMPPLNAEDKALARFLIGDAPVGAGNGGTIPPADSFPADPALAPFPSPENSQIVVFNGAISGRPYLKDQAGSIHTIRMVAGAPTYFKGGTAQAVWPGETVQQCLVRQGEVYMQIGGGIWKHVDANGAMYNRALPSAWVTTGGGTGGGGGINLPPVTGDPPHAAVAPGSSGRTVTVGPGKMFATAADGIRALQPGDTLVIDAGTYREALPTINVPAHIIATGAVFDFTGIPSSTLAQQKGGFVPAADCIIEGVEVIGAGMDLTSHDSTAAIRPTDGCGWLETRNCHLHGNQNGVAGGGFPFVWIDRGSLLEVNGLSESVDPSGGAHNAYVSSGCVRAELYGTRSINPVFGHAIKSRAPAFKWIGGEGNATDETILDLPDGTTSAFVIQDAVLTKPATAGNHGLIGYGMESQTNGMAGGSIKGGALNALCVTPSIQTTGGTIAVDASVALTGNLISAEGGGTVTGLRAPGGVAPSDPPPVVAPVDTTFLTYLRMQGDANNFGTFANQAYAPDIDPADFPGMPLTLMGWFKPEDYQTFGCLISLGSDNDSLGRIVLTTQGDSVRAFYWWASAWRELATAQQIALGKWGHLALVLPGSTGGFLDWDGRKTDQLATSPLDVWPIPDASGGGLRLTFGSYRAPVIGGMADCHVFNGGLRDWAVVKRALTQAEIAKHRSGAAIEAVAGSDLWSAWKFDALTDGKIRDDTGHGRDLTLVDLGAAPGHEPPQIVTPA